MLNMDFAQSIVIDTNKLNWQASPKSGVWRKPLSREYKEHGHATSIVKFDPGSVFSPHKHPGGEEILVLDGVFSDHTGDYQRGHYFRNPVGFSHAPFTQNGCLLLVKLHQFQTGDLQHLHRANTLTQQIAKTKQIVVRSLHQFKNETTRIEYWPAGASRPSDPRVGGEEIYVIAGCLVEQNRKLTAGTWLRHPHLSQPQQSSPVDTVIFRKTGHLPTQF